MNSVAEQRAGDEQDAAHVLGDVDVFGRGLDGEQAARLGTRSGPRWHASARRVSSSVGGFRRALFDDVLGDDLGRLELAGRGAAARSDVARLTRAGPGAEVRTGPRTFLLIAAPSLAAVRRTARQHRIRPTFEALQRELRLTAETAAYIAIAALVVGAACAAAWRSGWCCATSRLTRLSAFRPRDACRSAGNASSASARGSMS